METVMKPAKFPIFCRHPLRMNHYNRRGINLAKSPGAPEIVSVSLISEYLPPIDT
jgi:hypothetical protein